MPSRLSGGKKQVGVKQSRRALKNNEASVLYLAEDAENRVKTPLIDMCTPDVEIVNVRTMAELGAYCGIEVGAAAAVLLK